MLPSNAGKQVLLEEESIRAWRTHYRQFWVIIMRSLTPLPLNAARTLVKLRAGQFIVQVTRTSSIDFYVLHPYQYFHLSLIFLLDCLANNR